jgi:hypothetical protein
MATAQENPAVSVARIKAALESPTVTTLLPPEPKVKSWGPFSLVPPDTAGEMIKIRVPIGDLAMKTAHAIAVASHERAERKAHDEVARELQDFLTRHPK